MNIHCVPKDIDVKVEGPFGGLRVRSLIQLYSRKAFAASKKNAVGE